MGVISIPSQPPLELKSMLTTRLSTHGRSASSALQPSQSQPTTTIKTPTLVPSHQPLAVASASATRLLSTSCTTKRLPPPTTTLATVHLVVTPTLRAASTTPTCGPSTTLITSAVTRMPVSRNSEHVNSLNKANLF